MVLQLSSAAQENLGASLSNYSPTSSIKLNPSYSADSKSFIDFNLVGLGVFGENNYVFVNGGGTALNRQDQLGLTITESYNTENAPYRAKFDLLVHTPSLSLSIGDFGVGIHTAARSALSVDGLTNHLANHIRNGFNFSEQLAEEFTTSRLRVGALTWLEYGLNASYVFKKEGRDMLTAGVTVKFLSGITGTAVNIDRWNYQVENDSILNSLEFIGEYGVHDFENASTPLGNGSGVGLDIGFNYKSMKKGVNTYNPHTKRGCKLVDYDYKFGLALIDLGGIKFGDGLTSTFEVTDSVVWEDYSATDIQTLGGLNDLVATRLLDSPGASVQTTDEFKALLPSAFSAQFDYNIGYGFFANASLVHGFGRKKKLGVERSHTFAITPRFESKPVDVALPIVIRDYKSARLGFALRVYYLTIGSDNIFSLIGGDDRETFGSDFYFNLKYTMFRPWYCAEAKSKRTKGRKSNACPSW